MNVRHRSALWRRIARVLGRRLLNLAENNDDARFVSNGERWLLREVLGASAATPAVVIDVGANLGGYTREVLALARDTGRSVEVHAFEPSSHCVKILRREFAATGNVCVVPVALADRVGEAILHAGKEGSSLASLVRRPGYAGESSEEVRVPLSRLDDYLERQHIERVDLLKLDVEGYELAALRGAGERLTPQRIDVIQFEYGGTTMDAGVRLRDIYTLLESRGYVLAKLFPTAIEVRPYQSWMENYSYANYLALAPRWVSEQPQ
jgi:FkbM family methyltransferase